MRFFYNAAGLISLFENNKIYILYLISSYFVILYYVVGAMNVLPLLKTNFVSIFMAVFEGDVCHRRDIGTAEVLRKGWRA